jgi:TorA maturation chaperone TorD
MEALDNKIMDNDTRTRIVVYDFLRRVFLHEPTDEFFGRLVESGILEDLNDLPGIEKMRSYVQSALSSGDIDAVRQDFYQLFLGPRRLKAPPWESVYRSELRLVNQKSTTEVRQLYARFGFETEAGQLEDHFGTECDFLFRLCSLLGVIDKHGRYDLLGVQKRFIGDHLLKWVPGFAEDIMKNALTDYFRGLGEFVGYWVRNEEEYLDTVWSESK